MPYITAYNVDVDLDIDVDDFLSECSSKEIKELINALIEDGHLAKHPLLPGYEEKMGTGWWRCGPRPARCWREPWRRG